MIDPPRACLDHALCSTNREKVGAAQVHVHDRVVVLGPGFRGRAVPGNPGRVQHDVKWRLGDERGRHVVQIALVEFEHLGAATAIQDFTDGFLQLVDTASRRHDMRTGLTECCGAGLSDAGRRSRDQRALAVQPK